MTLRAGVEPIAASQDGQTLALVQGLPRGEKFPYPQSRLFVVDLVGPKVRARLDMGAWSSLYTDGSRFYLLDPGKPDKNPQKNRNGVVQIASPRERRARREPRRGGGSRAVSTRTRRAGSCSSRAMVRLGRPRASCASSRAHTLVATLKIAANPKLLVRERGVVYVVGEKAVTSWIRSAEE